MTRPSIKAAVLFSCALAAPGALAGDEACPIATVCSQDLINQIPTKSLSNLNWLIQVTPSGYADFTVVTRPPFPRKDPRTPTGQAPLHELYSGEFALAVSYDGIGPMFLERCLRYPEVDTMSDFTTLLAPTFDTDTDGDGINEGTSMVGNSHMEVTVNYDMDLDLSGVAMGRGSAPGAAYELSDPFLLKVRYDFKNISLAPLTNVEITKFDHTHPANNETASGTNFVYDNVMHMDGALPSFQYDFTSYGTNSGLIDGFATGSQFSDHASIQFDQPPIDFGFGTYAGHGAGNPSPSLYCTVVNGSSLGGETTQFGGEVAAASRFSLGTLAPNETKSLGFLLTVQSKAQGISYEGCLRLAETVPGAQPTLTVEKGACPGQNALKGAYDITTGSLYDLSFVDECSPGSFDCTALKNLLCIEKAFGFDQRTLNADAHRLDAAFYLARPAGRFTSWGMGSQPDGFPVERFFFTPSTIPDVDVVDVCAGLYLTGDGSGASGSAARGPTDGEAGRRFTYDIDAWADAMHEQILSRERIVEPPTP